MTITAPSAAATAARDPREIVGISSITFRHRPVEEALRLIHEIGAVETELGAIPDVVKHVPVPFDGDAAPYLDLLATYDLRSGAVNADIGNINDPDYDQEALRAVVVPLIGLAKATGGALIVNCGRQNWDDYVDEASDLAQVERNLRFLGGLCADAGVRLLVEVLHHRRWVHTVERANRLLDAVDSSVFGLLLDVSHVEASDEDVVAWTNQVFDRIERVHFRDAVSGNLNLGLGRGRVDFAGVVDALESRGFQGHYILELETRDVQEADREADALRSFEFVKSLVEAAR